VDSRALTAVVRGIGDVGSGIAHRLFVEGHRVVIHDGPLPTTRRGMAFADAVFDGSAVLDDVHAVRAHDLARVREALDACRASLRPVGIDWGGGVRSDTTRIQSG